MENPSDVLVNQRLRGKTAITGNTIATWTTYTQTELLDYPTTQIDGQPDYLFEIVDHPLL